MVEKENVVDILSLGSVIIISEAKIGCLIDWEGKMELNA